MVFAILANAQDAAMARLVPAAVGEHGMEAQVGARAPRFGLLWSPLILALGKASVRLPTLNNAHRLPRWELRAHAPAASAGS